MLSRSNLNIAWQRPAHRPMAHPLWMPNPWMVFALALALGVKSLRAPVPELC